MKRQRTANIPLGASPGMEGSSSTPSPGTANTPSVAAVSYPWRKQKINGLEVIRPPTLKLWERDNQAFPAVPSISSSQET